MPTALRDYVQRVMGISNPNSLDANIYINPILSMQKIITLHFFLDDIPAGNVPCWFYADDYPYSVAEGKVPANHLFFPFSAYATCTDTVGSQITMLGFRREGLLHYLTTHRTADGGYYLYASKGLGSSINSLADVVMDDKSYIAFYMAACGGGGPWDAHFYLSGVAIQVG